MKKIAFISAFVALAIVACNNDPRTKLPQTGNFGITFDTSNAIQVADIEMLVNMSDNIGLKATGIIASYCRGEGCWLTLKNTSGEDIWVDVKDKAFVLPYNIDGKTAFVNGVASRDTTEEGKDQIKIIADGIFLQ